MSGFAHGAGQTWQQQQFAVSAEHRQQHHQPQRSQLNQHNKQNQFQESSVAPANDFPGDVVPAGRPRLMLKPRSKTVSLGPSSSVSRAAGLFGQARSREDILRERGVDARSFDKKIDRKVQRLPRMNKEERATYDALIAEHEFAKAELVKASTEDAAGEAQAEIAAKMRAITEHLDVIRQHNEERLKASSAAGRPRFERPSERRRRQDERDTSRQQQPQHFPADPVYSVGHQFSPPTFAQPQLSFQPSMQPWQQSHQSHQSQHHPLQLHQSQPHPQQMYGQQHQQHSHHHLHQNRHQPQQIQHQLVPGAERAILSQYTDAGVRGVPGMGFASASSASTSTPNGSSMGGPMPSHAFAPPSQALSANDSNHLNQPISQPHVQTNSEPKPGDTSSQSNDTDEAGKGQSLYVGNLSYRTDENRLREIFETFGTLTEIRIPKNRDTGQSRGFGFISFSEPGSASAAIAQVNGKEIEGRTIKVNYKAGRQRNARASSSSSFSSNSPGGRTRVHSGDGSSLVLSSSSSSSRRRNDETGGIVGAPGSVPKVYVGNLSYHTDEDRLRTIFEEFGVVLGVRIPKDRETGRARGFGFVTLDDLRHANNAIETMHGQEVDGRTLHVSLGRNETRRTSNSEREL